MSSPSPPSPVASMLGSALAGMLSRIPCHPLDTIKARLQVGAHSRSIASEFKSVLAVDGVLGLYRGFGITFLASAPGTLLYFNSYEAAKRLVGGSDSNPDVVSTSLAGVAAEVVACVLFVPVDVVKERLQVQSAMHVDLKYSSASHAIRSIVQVEGVRGLYRGYGATIASFGPFSALYFTLYEQFKSAALQLYAVRQGDMLPFQVQLGTACAAGSCASFLTNPLDLLKLRLQVQRRGVASPFQYRGMTHALYSVVAKEGVAALFRGATARVLFHAPSTGITMALYERCTHAAAQLLDATHMR